MPDDTAIAEITPAEKFWQSLRAGKLILPRCTACDRAFFYPRTRCPHCWSAEVTWFESTGEGTVFASSTVFVPFQGIDPGDVPYGVALVDLDDGVRLPGRVGIDAERPVAGDRVRAVPTTGADTPTLEFHTIDLAEQTK